MFSVSENTTIDGILLGPEGRIALTYQGEQVSLAKAAAEVSYARAKGRKVLVRAPGNPAQPTIDPNVPLLAHHLVYGVDTNTRIVHGTRTSIGCVSRLDLTRDETGCIIASDVPVVAIELHNVVGDPERIVWRLVCEGLMEDPEFRPGLKVGLVVDSSLNDINRLNQRQIAVVDDFFLPEGFTLIYASSDSASASIANRLIAACDNEARKLLDVLAGQTPSDNNLHEGIPGEPWSHIRNRMWGKNVP